MGRGSFAVVASYIFERCPDGFLFFICSRTLGMHLLCIRQEQLWSQLSKSSYDQECMRLPCQNWFIQLNFSILCYFSRWSVKVVVCRMCCGLNTSWQRVMKRPGVLGFSPSPMLSEFRCIIVHYRSFQHSLLGCSVPSLSVFDTEKCSLNHDVFT